MSTHRPSSALFTSTYPGTCTMCGDEQGKYRCPACQATSCSLPCVKAHKQASGCTGKRPRTEFVPIKEFDEHQLMADYRFLEDASLANDVARRIRGPAPPRDAARPLQLPKHLHLLQRSALSRNICLQFMHPGMSRRKANGTRWCNKTKGIVWLVEWELAHTPGTTVKSRVHESTVLADALRTAFSGSRAVDMGNVSAAVLETLQGGSLRVLMRKHGTPVRWKWVLLGCCPHDPAQANAPEYYALSLESTLGQALAGTVVVEFPSLLLVWQGEEHYTLAARAGPAPE